MYSGFYKVVTYVHVQDIIYTFSVVVVLPPLSMTFLISLMAPSKILVSSPAFCFSWE